MAKTKTSSKVKERYNSKAYDKTSIRTRKDELTFAEIARWAHRNGYESFNAFVMDAIKEKMGVPTDDKKPSD